MGARDSEHRPRKGKPLLSVAITGALCLRCIPVRKTRACHNVRECVRPALELNRPPSGPPPRNLLMQHQPLLEFWYEFSSTYSYLSAMRIEAAAGEAGVAVVWRPFLLGPVFKAQGWDSSPF